MIFITKKSQVKDVTLFFDNPFKYSTDTSLDFVCFNEDWFIRKNLRESLTIKNVVNFHHYKKTTVSEVCRIIFTIPLQILGLIY